MSAVQRGPIVEVGFSAIDVRRSHREVWNRPNPEAELATKGNIWMRPNLGLAILGGFVGTPAMTRHADRREDGNRRRLGDHAGRGGPWAC